MGLVQFVSDPFHWFICCRFHDELVVPIIENTAEEQDLKVKLIFR